MKHSKIKKKKNWLENCGFTVKDMRWHREENQLDATECFIAPIIFSTCFGHLYAHHQELETILVLLPHMVCNALVAGGRLLAVAYPGILFGGGVHQIQLRTEDRENGDVGVVAP